MAKHRCAILDDYQSVAQDGGLVEGRGDLDRGSATLGGADEVARALKGFAIICAMRERTLFRASGRVAA
jgi:D-3-phosphoglycerate dehydrogenase